MKSKLNLEELIAPKYRAILGKYELYVATPSWNFKNVPDEVYNIKINKVAVNEQKNFDFLELLNRLDGMAYGTEGIPMDKWVAYDMAMLPSMIIGFGVRPENVSDSTVKAFEAYQDFKKARKIDIKKLDNLIPVSEYCAIPSADSETWVSHTLGVWSGPDGKEDQGLGTLTKAIAMAIIQPKYLIGVAQYNNFSTRIHSKFDDMELLSALTPAHSLPEITFTYRTKIPDAEKLVELLNESSPTYKEPSFNLDPEDIKKKEEMQRNIAAGTHGYWILRPALVAKDGKLSVPIREVQYS